MLVEYLGRACIAIPCHPLVNQDMTSEFAAWLNLTSKVFEAGSPLPLHPTEALLDALWNNWKAFRHLMLGMRINLFLTGELP